MGISDTVIQRKTGQRNRGGDKSKKELQKVCEQMEKVPANETMILVATGQMVGEGFNYPRLDTLIMATPISYRGIVEQYALSGSI